MSLAERNDAAHGDDLLGMVLSGSAAGPPDELLGLVQRTLDGDVSAIRETFARVRPACSSYDAARGHTRTTDMVEGWGEELRIFEPRAG